VPKEEEVQKQKGWRGLLEKNTKRIVQPPCTRQQVGERGSEGNKDTDSRNYGCRYSEGQNCSSV
jgi:hypothetical protein